MGTTDATGPADLARRLYAAWMSADRAEMERLLAPDFTFTSPYDDAIDRDAFFATCWPHAGSFLSLLLTDVVTGPQTDGDGLCLVTYEAGIAGGKRIRNAEAVRTADGRVRSVEVFFGRPPGVPEDQP